MADRSVVVKLRAEVDSYVAGMQKARSATTEFGKEVTGQGKASRADIEAVGRTSLIASGVMVAGFGAMAMTAANFEKEMSGVRAVSNASAHEMDALSDAALAAGASQKLAGVSASDAARAEGELVKAGVSVADVLGGGLMGSLTLASAGQLDFAAAAEIAAQAMNIFDLKGSQVTHVADVLAAAANKSAADVGQLGDALKQGGLVAAQTGLSMEETVGALAAFADNALLGSDAGTSLKTMLQRLTPQSAEAAGLMKELGFSAYDAQGNFIGLEGLAGELQTSLQSMTVEQRNSAMATLFGSDAVRAANILYNEGAAGIADYVSAVNDQGAAARMAAIQNDNLKGDVEALGGALETALIENGSKGTDVLRSLTQGATNAVVGFSSMPAPLQTTAMGLGAVTAGGLGVLGVIGTFGPKLREAKSALEGMGTAGNALAGNLGKIGGALGVAGAGLAVFAAWETVMADARAEAEGWMSTWHDDAMASAEDGMGAFADKLAVVREEQRRLGEEADNSSAPWDADKRAQLRAGEQELASIGDEMDRVADIAGDLADKYGISTDAALAFITSQQASGLDVLADDYDTVAESVDKAYGSMMTGTVGSQELAGGMETLGSETASVEDQVKAFGETLDALFSQFFGVESAQDAFQRSLNELPGVLDEARTAGLNLNDVLTGQSDAALDVRDQMRDMVSASSDLIAEWQAQGITGDDLNYRIALLSQSFRDQAVAAGTPAPVVDHYLGLLAAIPLTKTTTVTADTMTAQQRIDRLNASIAAVPKQVSTNFIGPLLPGQVRGATGGSVPGGLTPIYRAGGGPSGTDTVPAWLTPGEFVMQKSAVDRFGLGMMQAINSGRGISSGGGGYVFAPNVIVHATADTDGRQVGAQIVDALADYARSNGPLPASITG